MKRPYTYDFPAKGGGETHDETLLALSYIVYARQWVTNIADWNHPGVLSPYWRLLHCSRGRCRVRFGAAGYALNRHSVLLIPPEIETDLESDGAIDMLFAHFLPILPVGLVGVAAWNRPLRLNVTPVHRSLVELLAPAGRGSTACDLLVFRALLDVCFARILGPFAGAHARVPDVRVQRMLAWMREHFAGACPNVAVGRSAGLGPDQAVRLCKTETGRTPQAHLRDIRLTEATRLLTQSGLSVEHVADACGFANRFHLTRAFAVRYGIGPAAFRKRMACPT
jgi:AraC-like DNA-binding protein